MSRMSREERIRESEERAGAPYDIGMVTREGELLRQAYERRPPFLAAYSWDEWLEWCRERDPAIRKAFEDLDENHDGVVTASEVAEALSRVEGGAVSTQQMRAARMVDLADADRDGRIDYEEFRKLALRLPRVELAAVLAGWKRLSGELVDLGEGPNPARMEDEEETQQPQDTGRLTTSVTLHTF